MNVDKALANLCISSELRRGGDTGRRRVEHRSFLKLWFTHNKEQVSEKMKREYSA